MTTDLLMIHGKIRIPWLDYIQYKRRHHSQIQNKFMSQHIFIQYLMYKSKQNKWFYISQRVVTL